VPVSQFTKPFIRKINKKSKHKKMPYGIIHIRYNDTRLLKYIKQSISEYVKEYKIGQVPEWPNGPDCVERSVAEKSAMEKWVNSGEPQSNFGGILSQGLDIKNVKARCRD